MDDKEKMIMETRWLYVTSEEFAKLRDASKEVCVIPMGCVEKHGLHLPLGTDIMRAKTLAYEASQLETFCVFPDFTFGDKAEGYPMPDGTITLPLETEMLLLEQLCDQIARNGFKKIAIYSCHGGNRGWLRVFLRKMENKLHNYVVVLAEYPNSAPHGLAEAIMEKGAEAFPELNEEDIALLMKYHEAGMKCGHACFNETAHIMGAYPETVHLDRLGIEDGHSRNLTAQYSQNGIIIRDGGWGINFPDSFDGDDPVGCNERIGKAAIRLEAERLAASIKFLKEEDKLVQWHNQNWGTNL